MFSKQMSRTQGLTMFGQQSIFKFNAFIEQKIPTDNF